MGILRKYGVSLWLLVCVLLLKIVNIALNSSIINALAITTLILCGLSLLSIHKKEPRKQIEKVKETKKQGGTTKKRKDTPQVAPQKRNRNMEI